VRLERHVAKLTQLVGAMLDDKHSAPKIVPPSLKALFSGQRADAIHQLDDAWALGDSGTHAMEEAVDLCLNDAIVADTAERKDVERIVGEAVLSAWSKKHSAAEVVRRICAALRETPAKHTVFLPLVNLRFRDNPIEIGCVSFCSPSADAILTAKARLSARVGDTRWAKVLAQWDTAASFAVVSVCTHRTSTQATAERYVEEALHYIRCYRATTGVDRHSSIGLVGSCAGDMLVCATFVDGDEKDSVLQAQHRGALMPVDLGARDQETMEQLWGLEGLSSALSILRWQRRQPAQEMANRLTMALHWCGQARLVEQASLRVVYYCTAMEALLLKRGDCIRSGLAKRLGWLLERWSRDRCMDIGTIAPSPDWGRAEIERWAKKMYDVRSAVAHGGELFLDPSEQRASKNWPFLTLAALAAVADHLEDWPTLDEMVRELEGAG